VHQDEAVQIWAESLKGMWYLCIQVPMRYLFFLNPKSSMAFSPQFLLLILASTTLAILWDGPAVTDTPSLVHPATIVPIQTEAPQALLERDVFPPEFCGYLWGVTPYSPCDRGSTCVWRKDISAVGCCRDTTNLNTCQMYTRCIDYSDLDSYDTEVSDSLVLRW
jgi:hypothetical protein